MVVDVGSGGVEVLRMLPFFKEEDDDTDGVTDPAVEELLLVRDGWRSRLLLAVWTVPTVEEDNDLEVFFKLVLLFRFVNLTGVVCGGCDDWSVVECVITESSVLHDFILDPGVVKQGWSSAKRFSNVKAFSVGASVHQKGQESASWPNDMVLNKYVYRPAVYQDRDPKAGWLNPRGFLDEFVQHYGLEWSCYWAERRAGEWEEPAL